MKKKDTKQRLFEMMEKVNPDFKKNLNETFELEDDYTDDRYDPRSPEMMSADDDPANKLRTIKFRDPVRNIKSHTFSDDDGSDNYGGMFENFENKEQMHKEFEKFVKKKTGEDFNYQEYMEYMKHHPPIKKIQDLMDDFLSEYF